MFTKVIEQMCIRDREYVAGFLLFLFIRGRYKHTGWVYGAAVYRFLGGKMCIRDSKRSVLQRFIIWREKNIKEKRFILILSFLVGIFTAFAALILLSLIHI